MSAGFLVVLGLVVALAGAAIAFADSLAAIGLALWLRMQGLEPASDPQVDIGPTGAVVGGLRTAAGGIAIDRIAARYSVHGLWETGRVASVTISGLSLRGRVTEDGRLDIEGLPDFGGGDGAGGFPELPFARLSLTDAHLALDTPAGPVDIALAVEVRAADGALALAGLAGLVHEDGALSLTFQVRGRPGDALSALVEIEDGRVRRGPLRADGLDGWVVADMEGGALTALHSALTATRLALGAATLAPVEILFAGTPQPHLIMLRAHGPGTARLAADLARAGDEAPPALRLDMAIPSMAAAMARLADLPPADAVVRLLLDAETPVAGLLDLPPPEDRAGRGRLRLAVERAYLADAFRNGALSLDTDFTLDGRALRLDGRAPWRIQAVPQGFGLPISLALSEADAAVDWGRNRRLALDGTVALASGRPREPVTGPLAIALGENEGGWQAERLALDLSGGRLDLGPLAVRPDRMRVEAAGAPEVFAADIAVDLGLDGRLPDLAEVAGGALALSGQMARDGDRLTATLEGCLSLSADRMDIGGTIIRLPQGLSLCPVPEDGAPTADLANGGLAGWNAGFRAGDIAAQLQADGTTIDLAIPELRLSTERTEGDLRARLAIRNGAIALPESAVAVDDLDATLTLRGDGARTGELVLGDAALRLTGEPPPVVPIRLTGRGRIADWQGLAFTASGVGADGALRLHGEGTISFVGGGGRVALEVEPIAFAPEILRPVDVFPILVETPIIGADGELSGEGQYGWGALREDRGASIRIVDLLLATEFGAASGIDGELTVTGFTPVTMPAGQRVTVEAVDLGLLLEDGEIVFGLPDGERLAVSEARFAWLGGTVRAAPFTISLNDPERRVTLHASDVELSRLLAQVPLEGLSATGTLRGTVPLRLTGDIIRIDDGVLEATGPGIIRYAPEGAVPGFGDETGSVDLLLEAAENFHYDDLSLTLSGRTGEDLQARLRLVGGNPDLFDGYPVALNVNLEGALDQILRRGIATSRIGEVTRAYFERLSEGVVTDDFIEELERLGD